MSPAALLGDRVLSCMLYSMVECRAWGSRTHPWPCRAMPGNSVQRRCAPRREGKVKGLGGHSPTEGCTREPKAIGKSLDLRSWAAFVCWTSSMREAQSAGRVRCCVYFCTTPTPLSQHAPRSEKSRTHRGGVFAQGRVCAQQKVGQMALIRCHSVWRRACQDKRGGGAGRRYVAGLCFYCH